MATLINNTMKSNNSARPVRLVLILLSCSLSWLCLSGEGWAQAPAPGEGVIASPFGVGGDYHTNFNAAANAKWIPQMATIGLKETRTIASMWNLSESRAWTAERQLFAMA